MSRGGYRVTRISAGEHTGDRIDWLDNFANRIEQVSRQPRTAVEVARERVPSLFEQISRIMSGHHSSKGNLVESKVQEYQEKIGLKQYLQQMKAQSQLSTKTAQELPKSFQRLPISVQNDIKNFVRNKAETHHGHIQVPALVEEVSKTFQQAGVQPQDVNDVEFEKFVSDQIIQAQSRNPFNEEHNVNLGKGVGIDNNNVDSANFDIFEGLNPVKY